ncbi:mandelate racemase/muconate lactonizing enzyme family protein [Blastococcus tunisiensis]|uniref:L-alanine-DL-glutamate epimerase n=1 Tax=Blastococcus tunisiensis TaxID=1798228 RepID=A0A1I1WLB4_9ACTN|nr:mandelate racemase/muconate lactonizing enzyme family protein [Blastococcus sp. DSM 46838]SFD95926.1 L-alanine-DL-glutamate epimerase [Blastococcus sp. DSM 46838]
MATEVVALEAFPVTAEFDTPPDPLSLGTAGRRDIVLVKVTCADGTVGWGEAFHGHAGSAVAEIVRTTMQDVVVGRDVGDSAGVNAETDERFLSGAGMAGGFSLALSGIDLALWDAYGKHLGQPVHRLLGGATTRFQTYAGGFTLGFTSPERLVAAIGALVDRGFSAGKVRVGERLDHDLARLRAVREAFPDFRIMTDANTGPNYDVAALAGAAAGLGLDWLEEPYPRSRIADFVRLRARGSVPVAAGENLAGAAAFAEWVHRGALDVVQPDVSRAGGLTESLRIGALALAAGLRLAPHISHGVINHAATLHLLSALGRDTVFEADPTPVNPLRDGLLSGGVRLDGGTAVLVDAPGFGVQVDEERLGAFAGRTGSPWPRPTRYGRTA